MMVFAFGVIFLWGCATQQAQTTSPGMFTPYNFQADQYTSKVDNFMVILDASSSMSEPCNGQSKFTIAKDFLTTMNRTIPELKLNAALRAFGHNPDLTASLTSLFYDLKEYSTSEFEKAIGSVQPAGGTSPLAAAIDAAAQDFASTQGSIALIIVSDGKDMGSAPLTSTENMKVAFGDRLCIYTVLIGADPAGEALLKSIADAGKCGFTEKADKLASASAMADYVEKVFLTKQIAEEAPVQPQAPMDSDGDGVIDDDDQCPDTPQGATVNKVGCWIIPNVNFDFDKWNIRPDMYSGLDEAAAVLKRNPDLKVEIQGHTDAVGSQGYNQRLSEKRAESVAAYLIDQGIEKERLSTKGYGFSKPVESNETAEGRAENRRVEIQPIR